MQSGNSHGHCDDCRPLAIEIPLTLRHHVLLISILCFSKVFDNRNLKGDITFLPSTPQFQQMTSSTRPISSFKTCLYRVIFCTFLSRLLSTSSLQSYPFPKFHKDLRWPKFILLLWVGHSFPFAHETFFHWILLVVWKPLHPNV